MSKAYSAKEPPPPPDNRVFPMEVRHKMSASVMIYETRNRGIAMYTVAYPFDGQRQRRMRRDFDDAFALAKEIALKMADGAVNALTLEGKQRFVYERTLELTHSTGMELDVLVSRAVEVVSIAGGLDQLIEAARSYESQRRGVVAKTVPEVVAELIEIRRSNNASELYLRDLRLRLEKRFTAAYKVPISSVTTGDIQWVYIFSNLALQFAKLAKAANIPWRRNGLRHSFISYRVAKTENVDKVALDAGNSAAVIRSNYLKMVTHGCVDFVGWTEVSICCGSSCWHMKLTSCSSRSRVHGLRSRQQSSSSRGQLRLRSTSDAFG